MRSRLVHEADGQRTIVAVLETGDEVMGCLQGLARTEKLSGAQITAIGAFSDATLLFFDWSTKDYLEIPVPEQVEVAAMLGDIGVDENGEPALHIHAVVSKRDGSAVAGHLKAAQVRPTLEVLITESPAYLQRRRDQESGLNLIKL